MPAALCGAGSTLPRVGARRRVEVQPTLRAVITQESEHHHAHLLQAHGVRAAARRSRRGHVSGRLGGGRLGGRRVFELILEESRDRLVDQWIRS